MMATMTSMTRTSTWRATRGSVYCLICTHTVEADVVLAGRKVFVKAGQKCPRCSSSLDPGYVLETHEAAEGDFALAQQGQFWFIVKDEARFGDSG